MKKRIFTILMILVLGVMLAGCKGVLESSTYDFSVHDETGTKLVDMTAIKRRDKKIKPFRDALEGAEHLYYAEISLAINAKFYIHKTEIATNNLVYKAQTFESGKVENLSPSVLHVPEFINIDTGNGMWNDPSYAKTGGNYYIVFAEINGNIRALGLISK